MKRELQTIERIENYILNKMNVAEKTAFENEMGNSASLASNVQFQQNLLAVIERVGLKKATQKARKKYRFEKAAKIVGISAIIAGAIAYGVVSFIGEKEEDVDNNIEFYQPIVYPENDSLSTDANAYLDQEVFKINTNADTVIESKDGVVVSIPANAFDTESEEIEVVLQTAVNPEDVLKAGLSTTSDGQPLETGGMFYIDAFDEEERVGLTKELTVDVPSGDKKAGMQIFEGEKTADGEINWVKPIPVASYLTPVDISGLDFYPPSYEFKLDEWGLYGKEFRDSLYFSFAFDNECVGCSACEKMLQSPYKRGGAIPERKITVEERDFLYDDNRPIDKLMTLEEAIVLCENGMLEVFTKKFRPDPEIGEKLFNGNCASCHFPNKDMTGPALFGSRERWVENSTEENFYAFIKNAQNVVSQGDEYAKSLFNNWGSVMNPQNVTNQQIDHIFAYVDVANTFQPLLSGANVKPDSTSYSNGIVILDNGIGYDSITASTALVVDGKYDNPFITGVNPANVQAIWGPAFRHTNLATKEFEERMPWIHKSCETAVLDVYVKNLDKPLSYSDSIVVMMTSGEVRTKFVEFQKRGEGGVEFNEDMLALYSYYQKKRDANVMAIKTAQENYWDEQDSNDQTNIEQGVKSDKRGVVNKSEIFKQEFKTNLDKAKKELGIPNSAPVNNPSSYTVPVFSLGWKNIDRKVSEITDNRESSTIFYKGQETSFTYEKWEATIENAEIYDKINVYNIPKNFNTYQKLKSKNGTYSYKFNADLKYQTLVVGWTAQSIFFYQDKQTAPGEYILQLKPVTNDEFQYNIATFLAPICNMKAEMDYIQFAQKDQVRLDGNKAKILLVKRIAPVIFPCKEEKSQGGHGDYPVEFEE